ncbi:MAG: CoA transferase, partial [Chloroflexi bacterium]|nr:CoA transferase [Chloroflexota bacterium]
MPFMALQGVRVIELATGIAGPFCGKLLADYGAEVVKIEPPTAGDPSRQVGSFPGGTPHPEKSALFLHLNAAKKGVTLNIESLQGQEVLRRLVTESDVLLESFKPGMMDSLGLGYESLREVRPQLVMASITPFGQTGPHSRHEFTELTLFAMGGAMDREGIPEREPLRYGGEMAQYFAGACAASATVAAALKALLTGRGEWIDVSMQECMAEHPHQTGRRAPFAYSGELDPRRQPHTPFSGGREAFMTGTFRCKDGYASFLPLGPRMWPNFADMIGRLDLLDEPRFQTADGRAEHYKELEAIFQEWLYSHTRYEVFREAQRARFPGGPVLTASEALRDPHFLERGYFADTEHPDAGALAYTGLPFRMSDAPLTEARPAPRLGQHNDEVFGRMLG